MTPRRVKKERKNTIMQKKTLRMSTRKEEPLEKEGRLRKMKLKRKRKR